MRSPLNIEADATWQEHPQPSCPCPASEDFTHLHCQTRCSVNEILPGCGAQPGLIFDSLSEKASKISPLAGWYFTIRDSFLWLRMLLTFPMKCKYLDVKDTRMLSITRSSVGFVWLTPCRGEGSHWRDGRSGTVGDRMPNGQCNWWRRARAVHI